MPDTNMISTDIPQGRKRLHINSAWNDSLENNIQFIACSDPGLLSYT